MAVQPSYDKYDPISGGFRARLAADLVLTNGSFVGGVSLNASGRLVVGAGGQSGLVGVTVKNAARGPVGQYASLPGAVNAAAPISALAGAQMDVITSGEINGLDTTAFPAGTKIYANNTTGALSTTSAGGTQIGHTVEAGRLIVRVARALA